MAHAQFGERIDVAWITAPAPWISVCRISLDFLSGGRTIFVACQGQAEPGGGAFEKEFAHFGIEPASRMRRMEEAIEILRLTSSRENVEYIGQYWRFRNLTVLPRPRTAADPHLGHREPRSEEETER
jgi:alkanesulfonate monooxygenase SsuD/methylene tetrahydromethanopterin reductase-like flavin-dependent oxidoreductase (luciferase family)